MDELTGNINGVRIIEQLHHTDYTGKDRKGISLTEWLKNHTTPLIGVGWGGRTPIAGGNRSAEVLGMGRFRVRRPEADGKWEVVGGGHNSPATSPHGSLDVLDVVLKKTGEIKLLLDERGGISTDPG